jgi:hypothetical protein
MGLGSPAVLKRVPLLVKRRGTLRRKPYLLINMRKKKEMVRLLNNLKRFQ